MATKEQKTDTIAAEIAAAKIAKEQGALAVNAVILTCKAQVASNTAGTLSGQSLDYVRQLALAWPVGRSIDGETWSNLRDSVIAMAGPKGAAMGTKEKARLVSSIKIAAAILDGKMACGIDGTKGWDMDVENGECFVLTARMPETERKAKATSVSRLSYNAAKSLSAAYYKSEGMAGDTPLVAAIKLITAIAEEGALEEQDQTFVIYISELAKATKVFTEYHSTTPHGKSTEAHDAVAA